MKYGWCVLLVYFFALDVIRCSADKRAHTKINTTTFRPIIFQTTDVSLEAAEEGYKNVSILSKFSVRVRSHNKMDKIANVVGNLVKEMDSLKEKWGHPKSFPDDVNTCDGNVITCSTILMKHVHILVDYARDKCKDCDFGKALEYLSPMLIIRLSDSVHSPSECPDRKCRIKEIFRQLRFLLNQDDGDDEFDDCEKCAVADLLFLLKQFLKHLGTVVEKPPADSNCDLDDWNCLLMKIKQASNTKRDSECKECSPQYSCEQCHLYRDCDYCHRFLGCSPCVPDPVICEECSVQHECRYCQRLGCLCNIQEDCIQCLTYKECNYCRANYGCKCRKKKIKLPTQDKKESKKMKCSKCLKTRECNYCKKRYGCDCGNKIYDKIKCSTCLKTNKCNYCKKHHGCKCKPGLDCKSCLKKHKCEHCHKKYGCKCKKKPKKSKICEKCLETRECFYCQEHHHCKCKEQSINECHSCHKQHDCDHCSERSNCGCKDHTGESKRCPYNYKCGYCHREYGGEFRRIGDI